MTRLLLLLSSLLLCLRIVATAQHVGAPLGNTTPTGEDINRLPTYESHGGAMLVVTVVDEKKAQLNRQAVLKLTDAKQGTSFWEATSDASQATFIDLTVGRYTVEVSAIGYLTAHKDLSVLDLVHTNKVDITLQRDPTAVDLDAPHVPLPPKASKETRRATSELNSNRLKEAQRHLDAAYKIAPSSAHVNFLLGYLSLQQKNLAQAQIYLEKSTKLDGQSVQALNLLGRVYLLESKNAEAQDVLQRAVAADVNNWTGHNLLADAYIRQHDPKSALAQADLAIEGGSAMSAATQIIRGEALANLGRDQEAIQVLSSYLQTVQHSPTAPQVQNLISQIQNRHDDDPQAASAPAAVSTAEDLMLASMQLKLSFTAWAPPSIDDVKPPVAEGVTCPYQQVIERSGERVQEFVDDVAKFSAIEDLLHERLDKSGNPATKETRKFDYVASISPALTVDEFRNARYGVADLPDQIVTNGFPALALVFHPNMRGNFDIRCEGLGQLHGQATWLLHFQQREDRPKRIQTYKVGTNVYPISLRGRAWVTADKFEIVRIESELVHPMPEIRLTAEHQITEYGPVAFPKKKVELWLPKTAEVYLGLQGHNYYRCHSFDHYMLFSVDANDKVGEAKGAHGPGSLSPQKRKYWWARNSSSHPSPI